MDPSIDGVLSGNKDDRTIRAFNADSDPSTQLPHASDNETHDASTTTAQSHAIRQEPSHISSPRPRDPASVRLLGRSSSLKTPRANVQHAVETRAHAQTAASFKPAKSDITDQRPATSAAHSSAADSTVRPTTAAKSLAQNVADKPQPEASAASSPGLFTPVKSPFRPEFERAEASEPLSSPSWHHTHRQAPKETHLAEVDVDPVSGRKIVNHYEIIAELGRGVHGKVKLGRDLDTGNNVAIKIVDRISKRKRLGRTGDQEEKIKKEIAILKKARHPNIVGLLEVIDDPLKKKVYIVLEHAELGEVEWRIRGEPEVCYVEYRRNQRESDGVFDNEEEDRYDQHIMETAHRHLEREERREWQEAQDRKDAERNDHAGPWSLEHGTQSEADPQSPTRPNHASNYASNLSQTQPETTANDTQDPHAPEDIPPQPRSATIRPPFDALSTAEVQASLHGDLQDNIYGTFETQSPQDRPGSAFGSFASSHQDYLSDRVPEHYSYVPTMSLGEIRRAIRDTMLGLEYLHYQGVVHRDIKPANLLQTYDHRVKISDFGVSYLGKATGDHIDDPSDTDDQDFDEALELAKTVGTPAFYAPELCRLDMDEENPAPVTNQIDLWAVGVTLYCLVFGRVPFHHDNTFALMRLIAEKDVYIPSRRLQAVDAPREPHEFITSPQSQTRQTVARDKRAPHDLVYEEVSEDLRDLLKRLLTKDPRSRMKLTELKHHPWLLTDISDPAKWIDESSPTALTQGKLIEISQEDVDVAIAPYGIGERAKSIASRVKRKVVDVLGYGKGTSRRRAKSSAAGTGRSSNASSSSTISQDGKRQVERRQSTRPAEQPNPGLKEPDHPLSRSLTASPEPRDDENDTLQEFSSVRPELLERGLSATGSVRTIRQRDVEYLSNNGTASALAYPSMPSWTERSRPSAASGFPESNRQAGMNNEKFGSKQSHIRASNFLRLGHEDAHSRPSIALSDATAAGQVRSPSSNRDVGGTGSSASSRAASVLGGAAKTEDEQHHVVTRNSSLSSMGSRGPRDLAVSQFSRSMRPHSTSTASPSGSPAPRKASQPHLDEDVIARAKDEQLRRLIQEGRTHHRSASSAPSPVSLAPCPPSPDDLDYLEFTAPSSTHNANARSKVATDAEGESIAALTACDSDEQFPPAMSQSTSNPSIPSAFSANSSIGNDEMANLGAHAASGSSAWARTQAQNDSLQSQQLAPSFEENPLIVGQDEEYSSGEDFLEMSSHRKLQSSARRGRDTQHDPAKARESRSSAEISPGQVGKL